MSQERNSGATGDLFRAEVPVADHHLSDGPDRLIAVHQLERGVPAWVPGGLVIGQHVNAVSLRQRLHLLCVFDGERQWLLDHHVNAARRGRLDDRQVLCNGAEGNDGFGVDGVQHALEVGVRETPVEAELLGVALHHISVRLVDPHRLDVALVNASQEPAHMAVRETGYHDSHRLVSKHQKSLLPPLRWHVFPAPALRYTGERSRHVCR